ncbi:MAG: glycine oxidase ThiO [Gemmatimonadota bacterium]|nr:glycine oxidase ThiO [Gemmatimonadota bacterium]
MSEHPDILIAGGGLVGAACARSLAGHGHSVRVVTSENVPGVATSAAAGMLAPLAEASAEDPLLGLSVRGRDLYHELGAELMEETGVDIGLWTEGIVQIARSEDEMEELKRRIAWQRQMGFKSDWLGLDDLRAKCPGITPDAVGGKLASEDGALEPRKLHEALLASASACGAEIVRGKSVTGVIIEQGKVTGVELGDETMSANAVLLAAGSWSGRVNGLPRPLSVEPVKGQMVAFQWPKGEPHSIVYAGRGYVIYRNGEAWAGSTMEYVGFDPSITNEGTDQVKKTAESIYPALAGQPPTRLWSGFRPGTPDGRPIVGPDPHVEGLWYATGHGRNGVLLAGITAEIIKRGYAGEELDESMGILYPGRFWNR